jgi:hypothetical protein
MLDDSFNNRLVIKMPVCHVYMEFYLLLLIILCILPELLNLIIWLGRQIL